MNIFKLTLISAAVASGYANASNTVVNASDYRYNAYGEIRSITLEDGRKVEFTFDKSGKHSAVNYDFRPMFDVTEYNAFGAANAMEIGENSDKYQVNLSYTNTGALFGHQVVNEQQLAFEEYGFNADARGFLRSYNTVSYTHLTLPTRS